MIDLSQLITAEQKQQDAATAALATLTAVIQAHLDSTAKTRGYDGILSLCSYASSTNPKFSSEALAGVIWRDSVWTAGYAIQASVTAGTRAIPNESELLAELPVMTWPAPQP